jgi:hypothetical protein
MSTAAAKPFGDMLSVNETLQTLDVSDNSFGKPAVGDQVKLKSSGKMGMVTSAFSSNLQVDGGSTIAPEDVQWESQFPAFCAGVAASPSLISVSTTFRMH